MTTGRRAETTDCPSWLPRLMQESAGILSTTALIWSMIFTKKPVSRILTRLRPKFTPASKHFNVSSSRSPAISWFGEAMSGSSSSRHSTSSSASCVPALALMTTTPATGKVEAALASIATSKAMAVLDVNRPTLLHVSSSK